MDNNTHIDFLKGKINENSALDFYIKFFNIDTEKNKNLPCIFCDSSDAVQYDNDRNVIHCFSCGSDFDIIALVENKEKVGFIEAVKTICNYFNISHELDQDETTAETKEEIEARQKKYDEAKKQRELKAQQEKLKEEQLKENSIQKSTQQAIEFSKTITEHYHIHHNKLKTLFPNQSEIFEQYREQYIGYDGFQESICILNRTDEKCYNIKHRTKWLWDAEKKEHLHGTFADGKWQSAYKSTAFPFPYDYFITHDDNKVIICEGEKDALNLLSYGINVLTLGGVSTKWDNYKHLLKDKIVYIWFDNDQAGYIESMLRYREFENIALEVYIIPFFHINYSLPLKYDISDFLKDKKFTSKDDIFHAIGFCQYKLDNAIADEIGEYLDVDLKKHKHSKEFYKISPLKEFKDIRRELTITDNNDQPVKIIKVKGELDNKDVDKMLDAFKNLDKDKNYKEFKDTALNSMLVGSDDKEKAFEKLELIFGQFSEVKQTLLTNYRQTHIVDMVRAFRAMAKKTNYTFGRYKSLLTLWNGTYHKVFDEEESTIKKPN